MRRARPRRITAALRRAHSAAPAAPRPGHSATRSRARPVPSRPAVPALGGGTPQLSVGNETPPWGPPPPCSGPPRAPRRGGACLKDVRAGRRRGGPAGVSAPPPAGEPLAALPGVPVGPLPAGVALRALEERSGAGPGSLRPKGRPFPTSACALVTGLEPNF